MSGPVVSPGASRKMACQGGRPWGCRSLEARRWHPSAGDHLGERPHGLEDPFLQLHAHGDPVLDHLAGDVDEVRVKVEWGYSVAADESRMWSHGDNLIYIGVTCYVIEDGKKIGHMDEVACDPTKPPGKGPCSDVVRWIMRQEENGKVLTDGNNTVASLFPDTWKE